MEYLEFLLRTVRPGSDWNSLCPPKSFLGCINRLLSVRDVTETSQSSLFLGQLAAEDFELSDGLGAGNRNRSQTN
jgi:hypothetical protein